MAGVIRWPNTLEEKHSNTERALEFLRGDGVILHQDACRGERHDGHERCGHIPPSPSLDLMEGNVKGVMKVILAIAERYQPKSVKPRSAPEPVKATNHNADTNLPRQDLIRPYTHPQTTGRLEYGHSLSQPAQSTYHGPSNRYLPQTVPHSHLTEDVYSSPIDQLPVDKPPQVLLYTS